MTTTINNTGEGGGGAGMILGIVIAVIIIALLFIYGLPALRGTTATPTTSSDTNINVTLPGAGTIQADTTTGPGTGQ